MVYIWDDRKLGPKPFRLLVHVPKQHLIESLVLRPDALV